MCAPIGPDLFESNQPTASPLNIEVPGCIARTIGLELPAAMSEFDWRAIGMKLAQARSATNWWMGDWWAFGEHHYGSRQALVMADDWDGPSLKTYANAAVVCRAFETSRRREVLSFAHHAEVAGLPAQEADALLLWAEEATARTGKPCSVRALRDEKHRRGQRVVGAFSPASVGKREKAVPVIYSSGRAKQGLVRTAPALIVTSQSVMGPNAELQHRELSALRRCLLELGEYDGTKLGTQVAAEQREEILRIARGARQQLDALIKSLEAEAVVHREAANPL